MKEKEFKKEFRERINFNDKFEIQAIKGVFGKHAYDLKISSTKSMHGHLLGATAALEFIASTLAIYNSKVPPTINQITPDPELDLNFVPEKAIDCKVDAAMSNSLGFGGHNAVVVIKKY
jgi:3-oxoacyl-[acyl-carrier-protein] synthase II